MSETMRPVATAPHSQRVYNTMSNRHERRRAEKLGSETKYQQIEISSIAGSVCAWDGCEHVSTTTEKDGWSHVLLYRGPIKSAFADIRQRDIQRDCCLCPEHARLLDEMLLKPIHPRSDHVEPDDDEVRFIEDGAPIPTQPRFVTEEEAADLNRSI